MVIVPACRLVTRLLAAALALTAILAAPARILAQSDRASPGPADPSVAAAAQETRKPVQTSDADHRRASSRKPAADTADKDGRAFTFGLLIVELAAHAPVAPFK
jgi:hypothetical protein